MKLKFRHSYQSDLEQIYKLHAKCFNESDRWYKSSIKHYLNKGIVIENVDKIIIGVLLQGNITPCNKKIDIEIIEQSANTSDIFDFNNKTNDGTTNDKYHEDIFIPVSSNGKIFQSKNIHYKELQGIVMICIDPNLRGKGLAKKLIEKHWMNNPNKVLCLNTRKSNVNAFMLYKSMGYEHIAFIKNKYFLPNEDSIFMIKET